MEEKKNKNVVMIIIGVVVVVLIVGIVAFLGIVAFFGNRMEKEEAKKQLNDAISTISDIKNSNIANTVSDTLDSNNEDDTEKQYAEVKIGQTVTVEDYLEYSFISDKFTNKLEPSNPDSYYHYYEAKSSDNILLAIKTKIKNLQTEEFDGEKLPEATIMYDGKYKYSCTLIVEEDDGSDLDGYDWYMDIEPLKRKTFYYYAELPKEAKKDGKSLTLRIDLKDNSYELKIR